MKLRLPLLLISALALAGTAVHAATTREEEQLSATESITTDTIFTKDVHLYNGGSFTTTIGEKGGAAPVVEMLAVRPSWNSHLNVDNGILKLGKVEFSWWGVKEYSMWIGWDMTNGASEAVVNVGESGRIEASSEIWIGKDTNDGSSIERAVFNIYGTVIAKGISSQSQSDDRNPGHSLNLLGGRLILGSGGLGAEYGLSEKVKSIYHVNLFKGTLGSYESWSSSRRNAAGGRERSLILRLDTPGYELADGTTSDGTGSLTVETAADTTITFNSKIEGTGTGELIKSGPGTLFIKSLDANLNVWVANEFTQSMVIAGGTLQIDSDMSIGEGRTITVRNDSSAETAAFELLSLSGVSAEGLGGWRTTKLNFHILEDSGLVFKATLKNPTNILQMTNNGVNGQGDVLFESAVVFDGLTIPGSGEYNYIVGTSGTTTAKDGFHISQNKTALVQGKLIVEKSRTTEGAVQRGLGIGYYNSSPIGVVASMVVEGGGLLEVRDSMVALSNSLASGHLILNAGGKADVWGIEDVGAFAQIALNGGTLKVGKGGIHFHDWSAKDDLTSKTGDQYLGNVYFSSGKLEISEDSFYRYTGGNEFAEKTNDKGEVTRLASVYTGHFILGKDSTGAIDDPNSRREIDVAEGATFTFEANILGQGGFNKTGKGDLVLKTANGYLGNTVVEDGALYLYEDGSLGSSGKLVLLSGVAVSAQGKSLSIANNIEFGAAVDTACSVTLGQGGQTEILNMGGKVDLLASDVTLNIQSGVVFSGVVAGKESSLSKTGDGALTFSGATSGVKTMNVREGYVVFGAEAALSGIQSLVVSGGRMKFVLLEKELCPMLPAMRGRCRLARRRHRVMRLLLSGRLRRRGI